MREPQLPGTLMASPGLSRPVMGLIYRVIIIIIIIIIIITLLYAGYLYTYS
jgi:hypothetical protein